MLVKNDNEGLTLYVCVCEEYYYLVDSTARAIYIYILYTQRALERIKVSKKVGGFNSLPFSPFVQSASYYF